MSGHLLKGIAGVFEKYIQKDSTEGAEIAEGSFPGACVYVRVGDEEAQFCKGWAFKYADREGKNLNRSEWISMTHNSIFDLASISKIFTTLAFLILQKENEVSLDTPVHKIIPGFLENNDPEPKFDKRAVTIWHLMTHTSGFNAEPTPMLDSPEMWQLPISDLRQSVVSNSLVDKPGTKGMYSDVNYLIVGFIIEEISGKTLDAYVTEKLFTPLELTDTCYNVDHSKFSRVVANEYSLPHRVLGRPQPVRGTVHDEKGHLFGGVAGHAGVYSTLDDMRKLCNFLLNKGVYNGKQIVDRDLLEDAKRLHTGDLINWKRGLGFEVDNNLTMGKEFCELPGTAYGHTGFTGTSFAINDATKTCVIFLSNRTHPTREASGSINPARVMLTKLAARLQTSQSLI